MPKPKSKTTKLSTKRLQDWEKQVVISRAAAGMSTTDIAAFLDRAPSTISRFLAEMDTTAGLAQTIIKAGLAKMATRLVAKANVQEIIQVFERPGIEVLQPRPDAKLGGGAFAIQVSVATAHCGTVVSVGASNERNELSSGVQEPGSQPLIELARTAEGGFVPREQGAEKLHDDGRTEAANDSAATDDHATGVQRQGMNGEGA